MKNIVLDKEATGKQIHDLRIARHITVEQLADMLGLESVQSIYKWQSSASMPTIDNLVILSGIFQVTLDEIIRTREIGESKSSLFFVVFTRFTNDSCLESRI